MGASMGMMASPVGAVAGAAIGAMADMIIGRKQNKAATKHMKAVRDNQVVQQSWQNRSMNLQQAQMGEIAAGDKIDAQVAALKAADRTAVSAGENGVGGSSIDRLTDEIFSQGSRARQNISRNVKGSRQQLMISKKAGNVGINSTVDSFNPQNNIDFAGMAMGAASTIGGDMLKSKRIKGADWKMGDYMKGKY